MRALVVDDHQDILDLYSTILESRGYKVTTAQNGRQALNILNQPSAHFSVLVSDFNMPIMNGKELIEEIVKQEIQIEKMKNRLKI